MVTTRQLRDGTVRFYDGRKKATIEQAKTYIKNNAKYGTIPANISPELRRYAGAVKGGISRAKSSIPGAGGKFMTNHFQGKLLKSMKMDLDKLKSKKGVSSIRDLFKDKAFKSAFDRALNTGVEAWYNSNSAPDKLSEFNDKIFINGELTDKSDAEKMLSDCLHNIKMHFEAVDVSIKFTFKKLDSLFLFFPTNDEIFDYDPEDIESFNEVWQKYLQVYISAPKKSDKKKKK